MLPLMFWLLGRRGALKVAALASSLALAGCAALEKPKLVEMFWPDPPEKPRIRFVKSFRGKDEITGPSVLEVLVGQQAKVSVYQPMGVALSEDGRRLYVADFAWNAVFVFDFQGKDFKVIGNEERYGLARPAGVALDGQENVYAADMETLSVRVYDKNGKFLRAIGKDLLVKPTGLAVDNTRQRLYVVDTGHNKKNPSDKEAHQVKVFDLEGNFLKAIGRRGDGDGEFNFPTFATVDPQGRLYVVDSANNRIEVFDTEGRFLWKFGRAGDKIGDFARAKGVALDSFGNIYVVDSRWSNVQIFSPKGELLLIFGGVGRYPGLLFNPTGIAIDKENKIYISDTFGRRVSMYELINTTAEDSFETPKVKETKGGGTKAGEHEKRSEAPNTSPKGGKTQ